MALGRVKKEREAGRRYGRNPLPPDTRNEYRVAAASSRSSRAVAKGLVAVVPRLPQGGCLVGDDSDPASSWASSSLTRPETTFVAAACSPLQQSAPWRLSEVVRSGTQGRVTVTSDSRGEVASPASGETAAAVPMQRCPSLRLRLRGACSRVIERIASGPLLLEASCARRLLAGAHRLPRRPAHAGRRKCSGRDARERRRLRR